MDRELTTLEHVHKVVQNLMWVYGDAEEPQDECVKFITRLLHQQLNLILSGAYDTAKSREKSEIGLIEILFEFRRDALYLRRLLRMWKLLNLSRNVCRRSLLITKTLASLI